MTSTWWTILAVLDSKSNLLEDNILFLVNPLPYYVVFSDQFSVPEMWKIWIKFSQIHSWADDDPSLCFSLLYDIYSIAWRLLLFSDQVYFSESGSTCRLGNDCFLSSGCKCFYTGNVFCSPFINDVHVYGGYEMVIRFQIATNMCFLWRMKLIPVMKVKIAIHFTIKFSIQFDGLTSKVFLTANSEYMFTYLR